MYTRLAADTRRETNLPKLPPIPLCKTASLGSFVRTLRALGVPVEAGLRRATLPVGFLRIP